MVQELDKSAEELLKLADKYNFLDYMKNVKTIEDLMYDKKLKNMLNEMRPYAKSSPHYKQVMRSEPTKGPYFAIELGEYILEVSKQFNEDYSNLTKETTRAMNMAINGMKEANNTM